MPYVVDVSRFVAVSHVDNPDPVLTDRTLTTPWSISHGLYSHHTRAGPSGVWICCTYLKHLGGQQPEHPVKLICPLDGKSGTALHPPPLTRSIKRVRVVWGGRVWTRAVPSRRTRMLIIGWRSSRSRTALTIVAQVGFDVVCGEQRLIRAARGALAGEPAIVRRVLQRRQTDVERVESESAPAAPRATCGMGARLAVPRFTRRLPWCVLDSCATKRTPERDGRSPGARAPVHDQPTVQCLHTVVLDDQTFRRCGQYLTAPATEVFGCLR